MRKLIFYGASDDLCEIEGTRSGEPDEFGPGPNDIGVVTVRQQDAGLRVVFAFVSPGVWSIGIAQLDEDMPLPGWPMSWSYEAYSAKLILEAPDHAIVAEAKP